MFECIGRGAFGDVYRAWDTRLDREVALKLLPFDTARADSRNSSIIEEGRLLARVRHPNVVTIYGAERTGGRIGLWMEFIKGRTLEQMLSEGHVFTVKDVVRFGLEVCRAASAVHGAGLLHRDIKAQNVMVADDGRVVLMDFGAGRELTDGQQKSVAGTPLYLAPEVLAGESASPRSEIYSIGVLLYRLLTGSYPVRATDLADLRRAHAHGERIEIRAARPDLPSRLARAVERAVDREPERRYESVDALAADLEVVRTRPRLVRVAYAASVTLALVVIVGGAWWLGVRRNVDPGSAGAGVSGTSGGSSVSAAPQGAQVWAATPVLSIPGQKANPALSPDGTQLAFVWGRPKTYRMDLYVKRLGAEGLLQLTHGPGAPGNLAWSPDGRFIAFMHSFADEPGISRTAIRIVPAVGGTERTLWSGAGDLKIRPGLDWSPDGTRLISSAQATRAAPTRLLLLSVATGEIEWLTSPLAGTVDNYPTFSPDGHTVAFVRESGNQTNETAIYLVSLENREPRRLIVVKSRIRRLAWSAGGQSLIFASDDRSSSGSGRLWRVSVPDAQLERLQGTDAGASSPSIARRTGQLVFLQIGTDENLYRAVLGAEPSSPEELVGTTRTETHPDISPDGSRVAFVSDRSGSREIWTMDAKGGDPAQVTSFQTVAFQPRWSPDGRRLAFSGQVPGTNNFDIHVVDAAGGQARRLTEEPSIDKFPSWSRDGQWIYFTSNRSRGDQIWKVPAAGGTAVPVIKNRALNAEESPDGRFVFYKVSIATGADRAAIWRMPIEGGEPVRIFDFPDPRDWGGEWMVHNRGLVFLNIVPSQYPTFELFDFTTRRTMRLFRLEAPYDTGSGFAISPDGTWILYPQRDFTKYEVMMMDVDR